MAGKPDFSEIPDNIFSLGQPASEPATYPAQLDSAARRNKPTAHAIGTPVAHSFEWPAGSSLDSGGLAATGTPKVKRCARTAGPGSNGMHSVGRLLASHSAPVCQNLRRRTPPRRRGSRPPGLLRAAPLPGEERAGARGQTGGA